FYEGATESGRVGALDGSGTRDAGTDGQPVAVHDQVAALRWHPRPWREDPDQVQRVHGGHAHDLARPLAAARLTQRLHGFRQRVLLTDEAGDEATTARRAPRLETPEGPEDLAPREDKVLTLHQVAEDDTVAGEQLLGHRLGQRLDVGVLRGTVDRLCDRQE